MTFSREGRLGVLSNLEHCLRAEAERPRFVSSPVTRLAWEAGVPRWFHSHTEAQCPHLYIAQQQGPINLKAPQSVEKDIYVHRVIP